MARIRRRSTAEASRRGAWWRHLGSDTRSIGGCRLGRRSDPSTTCTYLPQSIPRGPFRVWMWPRFSHPRGYLPIEQIFPSFSHAYVRWLFRGAWVKARRWEDRDEQGRSFAESAIGSRSSVIGVDWRASFELCSRIVMSRAFFFQHACRARAGALLCWPFSVESDKSADLWQAPGIRAAG